MTWDEQELWHFSQSIACSVHFSFLSASEIESEINVHLLRDWDGKEDIHPISKSFLDLQRFEAASHFPYKSMLSTPTNTKTMNNFNSNFRERPISTRNPWKLGKMRCFHFLKMGTWKCSAPQKRLRFLSTFCSKKLFTWKSWLHQAKSAQFFKSSGQGRN